MGLRFLKIQNRFFLHFERCGNAQLFENHYELKICLNDDNLAPARVTCRATIFGVLGFVAMFVEQTRWIYRFLQPS